jgi:Fe-S-cluster-containing dehydrogenase component
MEKCTFCLHRTRKRRAAGLPGGLPDRRAGVRQPADPNSEIRWVLANKRVFVLKEELGTKPRFFYFFDK